MSAVAVYWSSGDRLARSLWSDPEYSSSNPLAQIVLDMPVGEVFLLRWNNNQYALRRRLDETVECVVDSQGIFYPTDDVAPTSIRTFAPRGKDNRTIIRLTSQAQAARLMLANMGQGKRAIAPPRPDEIEEN